jgi:DNA-binding LytR/AlgR family response regulator
LAIIVAIVAFCLSGIFLLFLVPDPDRASSETTEPGAADTVPEPVLAEVPTSAPAAPQERTNNGNGAQPEFGRGTYAPLGGMGGPPRRFARHLPIERDGGTQFLPVDDVVAVHANSHYTFVFNGTDKLFCPLAIGEVESRLDNSRFVRIHRSHIVNIERVIGYKRSGDNEMVEMDAAQDYAVPVSRSRIGWLKTRVAAVLGTEPDAGQRRRHHLAPQ